jgi:CHAT domain-containing protein/Tfp pilus assembly protein PilF
MRIILILFFILFSFLSFAQINDSNVKLLLNKISQTEEKGDNSSNDYANLINNLAIYYTNKEMYIEAEPLLLKVSTIRKSVYGDNHLSYATSLNNLAFLYQKQRRYNDAENKFLNALKIYKDKIGERNAQYATFLDNLACLYFEQAKYSVAKPIFLGVLAIRKEIIGEKNKDYSATLNKLATINQFEGNYAEAELLFVKLVDINKEISGENSIEYAISIGNLGSVYNLQFKYNEAEILLLKALQLEKNIIGKTHPYYGTTLSNLALLYQNQGKFSLAEPFLKESVEIDKNRFGENNSKYAVSINNLALLYFLEGNYIKAEPLFFKALQIRKNLLGVTHPDYALSLDGLAKLYVAQGYFTKAESNLLEVAEINSNTFGIDSPNYATSLNNLAGLYQKQREFLKSEKLYFKASNIYKSIYGDRNPDYAISLVNLALSYQYQKKYTEAEILYLRALEINKQFLGENHPNYITTIHHLAILYRLEGIDDKASKYFEQFISLNQEKILDDIYALTENELIAYIKFKKINLFSPLSFLTDISSQYPIVINSCFNNELLIRNLTIRNKEQTKKAIQKSNNLILKDKYEQFVSNKRKFTKLSELLIDKRPSNFSMLIDETEQLEKELIKESTTFSDFKNSISINFNQIKNKLKKNEISIDIVSYNYYNKSATDSIVYSAFLVGKDFKYPKFIPLFEENQLYFLLERNKSQQDSTRIDKQYLDKAISDLFLKPLERELEGFTTIYLSLAGLGHQVNFAAFPLNDKVTFGEQYELHILSSPSEIMNYQLAGLDNKSNFELLLYGGIDYDKTNSVAKSNSEIAENNETLNELQTRSGISEFGYLAGSKKEVEAIQGKGVQIGFKTRLLDDRAATEESIKQLDGRNTPFILHLATHGYFFSDPEQETPAAFNLETEKRKIYKASNDPMMRSGLVFAGANKNWSKPTENTTTEDGILTASEISNLDLSACQLVVLSACETGLGEVKGSEGVFGLQRAFKMAGVKNIIMSLWKVPDTQTAELFDIFYSECFAGKTIHEAFQSAQTKMKAKYSPYYWAGFVLLE